MAYESIVRTKSIKATISMFNQQYRFVKIDSNGQIVLCGSGQHSIGVLQDKPGLEGGLTNIAGEPGSVCSPGDITKVACGGSFNAGGDIMSDANGNCVAATSGSFVLGVALTAGVNGFIADIIYQPKGSKL